MAVQMGGQIPEHRDIQLGGRTNFRNGAADPGDVLDPRMQFLRRKFVKLDHMPGKIRIQYPR